MKNINISEKILGSINDLIELYNQLPDVEKIAVIPEKFTKTMNLPQQNKENKIDVKDVYICLFDGEKVGAFVKEHIIGGDTSIYRWQAIHDVFRQYKGDLVGLCVIKQQGDIYSTNRFAPLGCYEKIYINCKLNAVENYDVLRQLMLEEGIISTYTPGESTESEMLKVITFARNYFARKNNEEKIESDPSKQKLKK